MFQDRLQAGRMLSEYLTVNKHNLSDVVVFALPRGGIVVADPIAKHYKTTLYPLVVRKIGAPGHEEFAIGALGEEDEIIMNNDVIVQHGFNWEDIEPIVDKERKELARRIETYRDGKPLPDVKNKTVLIVDDGLATGTTMEVCVKLLKKKLAKSVLVTVPIASKGAIGRLEKEADEVICLSSPPVFMAVGQFYESFPQVSDDEVLKILEENRNFVSQ